MRTTTDIKPAVSRIRVWDPLLRVLHWSLVATVVASWLTRHSPGRIHEWVGYGALVVVLLRVGWGFLGPRHARFRSFLRGPSITVGYLRGALAGRAQRHLGHNPLGGWSTVILLTLVTATGFTGWLYTTDRFWGIAWVGDSHLWLTNVLLAFVGLHVVGVAWTSIKSRENLVAAMLHGRKAPAGPRDVD